MVRNIRLLLWFLLLLAAYLLPWVSNPGVSLSPGGYDLAEWASIHPAAMAESPPLLTTLLLRLPLVCATAALTYSFLLNRTSRLLGAGAVALMSIALLPPFEFVDDPGNWNYRQQLALAVITFGLAGFGLTGRLGQFRRWISMGAAAMGVATALLGVSHALQWMQEFSLPTVLSLGGIVSAIMFAVLVLVQIQTGQRASLRRPIPTGQQH